MEKSLKCDQKVMNTSEIEEKEFTVRMMSGEFQLQALNDNYFGAGEKCCAGGKETPNKMQQQLEQEVSHPLLTFDSFEF
jgi:hypothetical protein